MCDFALAAAQAWMARLVANPKLAEAVGKKPQVGAEERRQFLEEFRAMYDAAERMLRDRS